MEYLLVCLIEKLSIINIEIYFLTLFLIIIVVFFFLILVKEKNIVNETKTENANENDLDHNSTEMCQSDVIDLNIKEVESKLNGENDVKLKEKEKEISEIVHDAGDQPMCNGFESQNGDVNTNSVVQNENAMDQETPPEDVQDSRGNRRSHSPSSQTPSDKTDSSSKSLPSTLSCIV